MITSLSNLCKFIEREKRLLSDYEVKKILTLLGY